MTFYFGLACSVLTTYLISANVQLEVAQHLGKEDGNSTDALGLLQKVTYEVDAEATIKTDEDPTVYDPDENANIDKEVEREAEGNIQGGQDMDPNVAQPEELPVPDLPVPDTLDHPDEIPSAGGVNTSHLHALAPKAGINAKELVWEQGKSKEQVEAHLKAIAKEKAEAKHKAKMESGTDTDLDSGSGVYSGSEASATADSKGTPMKDFHLGPFVYGTSATSTATTTTTTRAPTTTTAPYSFRMKYGHDLIGNMSDLRTTIDGYCFNEMRHSEREVTETLDNLLTKYFAGSMEQTIRNFLEPVQMAFLDILSGDRWASSFVVQELHEIMFVDGLAYDYLCHPTDLSAGFQYYRFTPTKLRKDDDATEVQMSSLNLYNKGGQVISYEEAEFSNPDGEYPEENGPEKAFDYDDKTIWVDKHKGKGGLVVKLKAKEPIYSYSITTGEFGDSEDPVEWVLESSNDGVSYLPLHIHKNASETPLLRFTQSKKFPVDELIHNRIEQALSEIAGNIRKACVPRTLTHTVVDNLKEIFEATIFGLRCARVHADPVGIKAAIDAKLIHHHKRHFGYKSLKKHVESVVFYSTTTTTTTTGDLTTTTETTTTMTPVNSTAHLFKNRMADIAKVFSGLLASNEEDAAEDLFANYTLKQILQAIDQSKDSGLALEGHKTSLIQTGRTRQDSINRHVAAIRMSQVVKYITEKQHRLELLEAMRPGSLMEYNQTFHGVDLDDHVQVLAAMDRAQVRRNAGTSPKPKRMYQSQDMFAQHPFRDMVAASLASPAADAWVGGSRRRDHVTNHRQMFHKKHCPTESVDTLNYMYRGGYDSYLDGCSVSVAALYKHVITPPCFTHDMCYECGVGDTFSSACDDNLLINIETECRRKLTGMDISLCMAQAPVIYAAVRYDGWFIVEPPKFCANGCAQASLNGSTMFPLLDPWF